MQELIVTMSNDIDLGGFKRDRVWLPVESDYVHSLDSGALLWLKKIDRAQLMKDTHQGKPISISICGLDGVPHVHQLGHRAWLHAAPMIGVDVIVRAVSFARGAIKAVMVELVTPAPAMVRNLEPLNL